MNKLRTKLVLAATIVACVFGGIAIGVAWATQGVGITTTILAGPTDLGEVDLKSGSDVNDVKIKIKGISDIYVVQNRITPGGHTGWHSHPGPSIISVVSGTATEYHDDDPNGIVHSAGTAFVDDGEHVHIVANEGDTDLVLIAFQILPDGATRRIDEDDPTAE